MRLRFNLRALLLVVLLASLLSGWFALQLADARRQARAVERLQELGGTVYYDFHHYVDDDLGGVLSGSRKPQTWRWARRWVGDDYFNRVYYVRFVEETPIPQQPGFMHFLGPVATPTPLSREADRHVALLHNLPDLHTLDLASTTVSEESIPELAKLTSLQLLWLPTDFPAEGLERLQELLPGCDVHRR